MNRILLAALSLSISLSSSACLIADTSGPQPYPANYSPIDTRLAPPAAPAVDMLFDLVFSQERCVATNDPSGISTWYAFIPNTNQVSRQEGCYDAQNQMPFAIRFENLSPHTTYEVQAIGYVYNAQTGQSDACYVANCSVTTSPYAEAVLPTCTISRKC